MNAAFLHGPGSTVIRILIGVTVLWLLAGVVTLLLRRSAAWRHRLWSLATLAAMLLPLLAGLLPEIRVGWIAAAPSTVANSPATPHVDVDSRPRELFASSAIEPSTNEQMRAAEQPPPLTTPTNILQADHSRNPIFPSLARASYLWLLILLAPTFCLWLGIARSLLLTRSMLQRATRIDNPELLQQLARWQSQLKWPWPVRLLESAETPVPVCAGWWQPAIVFPESWETWSSDALSAAVGHELAHVVRRDLVWQLLARAACGLYWFQPLAWLAAWRMRIEREFACDDVVLAAGQSPAVYARVLVDLASCISAQTRTTCALPMATRSSLEERVRGILAANRSRLPVGRTAGFLLTFFALGLALLAGMISPLAREMVSPSAAADEGPPKKPSTTQDIVPAIAADHVQIRGQVVDEAGRPAKNIRVTAVRPLERPQTRTDDQGMFSLAVLRSERPYLQLLADDGGSGFRQGLFSRWRENRLDLPDPIIKLGKTRAVLLKVVDSDQRPVEIARFGVGIRYATLSEQTTGVEGEASLLVPIGVPLDYIYAYKDRVGMDYYHYSHEDELHKPELLDQSNVDRIVLTLAGARTVRIKAVDEQGEPMSGVEVHPDLTQLPARAGFLNATWTSQITGADGVAEFRAMPANAIGSMYFRASRHRYEALDQVKLNMAEPVNEATVNLRPQVPVRGSVKLPGGKPAAHAVVVIGGRGPSKSTSAETSCNAAGEFEAYVNLNSCYLFAAKLDRLASAGQWQVITAGKKTVPIELQLEPATRVFGTLRSPGDDRPLVGEYIEADLLVGERDRGSKKEEMPRIRHSAKTDDRGRFELFAGRGRYKIWGTNVSSDREPTIELAGQKEHEISLVSERPPKVNLVGRIVLASDGMRAVPGAKIDAVRAMRASNGRATTTFSVTADDDGGFKVKRLPEEMWLWARSRDNKLGALVKVARDAQTVEVALAPTASAHGRLAGQPGKLVRCNFPLGGVGPRERFWTHDFGVSARTNQEGEFTLHGLVVGETYDLFLESEQVKGESTGIGQVKPGRAEMIELGNDVGIRRIDEK